MVSIILGSRGIERIEIPCDGRLELHAMTILLSAPEIDALHERCRDRSDNLWTAVEAEEDQTPGEKE